jgi:nickel-dependent lactate racemase
MISDEDMTVILALGLHRAMTDEEIAMGSVSAGAGSCPGA